MIEISMEAMFRLVPWRSATVGMRVVTGELPRAAASVNDAMIVLASLDPGQEQRSLRKARQVDGRSWVPGRNRHYDVRDRRETESRASGRDVTINDVVSTVGDELRNLPSLPQESKFAKDPFTRQSHPPQSCG